jgi:hypothetical protein
MGGWQKVMIVSNHAKERWIKRFNPKAKNVVEEIMRAKDQAIEILSVEECPGKYMEYSVKDNMLFVVDLNQGVLVTVVDIVFGFGEEIDREIGRLQTEKILRLKEEVANEEDFFAVQIKGIDEEMVVLEGEIEKVRAELLERENLKTKLREEKKEYMKKRDIKRKEYEKEVNKLRYSINYRLEMLTQKKEKTNGEVKL